MRHSVAGRAQTLGASSLGAILGRSGSEAAGEVVVDHAGGLHERVHRGRTDEAEPQLAQSALLIASDSGVVAGTSANDAGAAARAAGRSPQQLSSGSSSASVARGVLDRGLDLRRGCG